jgi:uncharacterized protein
MKKNLFVTLLSILLVIPYALSGQNDPSKKNITGSWLGTLSVDGTDLRVVFNLRLVEKDSLTVTLDSPDQGAKDIPGGLVTLNKQKLVIEIPSINGEYTGTVASDSTIKGTWAQNGAALPLTLKKQAKSN